MPDFNLDVWTAKKIASKWPPKGLSLRNVLMAATTILSVYLRVIFTHLDAKKLHLAEEKSSRFRGSVTDGSARETAVDESLNCARGRAMVFCHAFDESEVAAQLSGERLRAIAFDG